MLLIHGRFGGDTENMWSRIHLRERRKPLIAVPDTLI